MRALVLGLEGLAPELTFRWTREGALAALGALQEQGVWGELEAVPGMDTVAGWHSLLTGLNPGRHGFLGNKEARPRSTNRLAKPFWRYLNNLGYTVDIIGVPSAYPILPRDGFALPGRGGAVASPSPRLARRIKRLPDTEAVVSSLAAQERWQEAAQAIMGGLEAQRELLQFSLEERKPDVLLVAFQAADLALRFFWRYLEPDIFGLSGGGGFGGFVSAVYRRLDEVTKELIERTVPEVTVILSPHGGGFNPRGNDYLPDWLQVMGLLYTTNGKGHASTGVGPAPTPAEIDWARTMAYRVGTDAININLRDREPQGIVPHSQYDSLCQEIITWLLATVDPENGEPAAEMVAMGRDLYHGPFADQAPDIMIRWRTDRVLSGLETPGYRTVRGWGVPLVSGSRRQYGVLLATGQGLRRAQRVHGMHVTDLAPTLLHLLGSIVPARLDGVVRTDLFEPAWLAMYPVVEELPATRPKSRAGQKARLRDEQLIEERLRGLGYID